MLSKTLGSDKFFWRCMAAKFFLVYGKQSYLYQRVLTPSYDIPEIDHALSRWSAHVDELFLALSDEFYLRSDSLIQPYWRWHKTKGGQDTNWSTLQRKTEKHAQGKYTKCFIYSGLGALQSTGSLIMSDSTQLNAKLRPEIHAKCRHETRASSAAFCCPADIVTHVDALNKLKHFRNSGKP